MNTILQKRIEEAATFLTFLFKQRGLDKESCRQAMDYILSNQWISVDEALPPLTQESGQVYLTVDKNGYVDVKARNLDGWSSSRGWCSTERITHWMCIPSLEGGEK